MPLRSLSVAGLNHRTAPVALRERFAFSVDQIANALAAARALGAEHAALLSTCNRTEVYATSAVSFPIERFFLCNGCLSEDDLEGVVYVHRGRDAVRHLFRVAAGIDSQVLGESEVLGQVKKAWSAARDEGATGAILDAAFQRALIVGKRVRSETDLGREVVSIGSLALRLAIQSVPDFSSVTVLVVGTGEMSSRIVRDLRERPPVRLLVVSHTLHLAERLAEEAAGEALAIGQLGDALAHADVVFSATASPHPVIERQALAQMAGARRGRPLHVFDLGVPRNTEPEVRGLDFVRLHDIDDLKALSEHHRRKREGAVPDAERIIREEIGALAEWCARRDVAPLISAMRARADAIRRHQLQWAESRLEGMTAEQMAVVDKLTERLVRHLIHFPIHELRTAAGEAAAVSVVARMLGLDRPAEPGSGDDA